MAVALLASEYAHSPTILATFAACAVIPAIVGRPWTLLLPVALIVGVVAAGLSSWVYERVPEDIQAGIFIGAGFGLVASGVLLLTFLPRPFASLALSTFWFHLEAQARPVAGRRRAWRF